MQDLISYLQDPIFWTAAGIVGIVASSLVARLKDRVGKRQIPVSILAQHHYATNASDEQVLCTVGALGYQIRSVFRIGLGLFCFCVALVLPLVGDVQFEGVVRAVLFAISLLLVLFGLLDDRNSDRFRRKLYSTYQVQH